MVRLWSTGMAAVLLVSCVSVFAAGLGGPGLIGVVGLVWLMGVGFILFFFRDPVVVREWSPGRILCPAYGRVDVVDEQEEPRVMGGRCRRVSIFLSVFDVHVQKAPVRGRIVCMEHTPGAFANALRPESARTNENVLIGIMPDAAGPGSPVAVRLIAGAIARRIVPLVGVGDMLEPCTTMSLIQFGSRVDVYLPLSARVLVKPGDRARGPETLLAELGPSHE